MPAPPGVSRITQRLAGLSQMHPSARPGADRSRADGGTPFATALQTQMLASGQVPSLAPGTTAQPTPTAALQALASGMPGGLGQGVGAAMGGAASLGHGFSGGAAAGAATMQPPELGARLRFTNQSSLITPVVPTGQPADPSAAVHADGAHAHAPHGPGEPHVHAAPALDRQGPPAELQAYGNGRIPADALEPLGIGDHSLWSPAAHAFRDLMAAAQRDGIDIGINDSYRSYERQIEMVERYGLYSQGGRAAQPGTSNHGWGVSMDLQLDDDARAWMREHAADYGFVEDVPREPWHWTFKASSYGS